MGKYSNYNQKLGNAHVWVIVFVKSLDHIGRKFFEYFAYFLAFDYFNFSSFYMFSWCVAAIDFSAILSMFILPFIIDKSPKKLQVICQSLIGKSIIAMAFWKGFGGLFVLRFIFGLAYSLLLSIWSCCVAAFIPHVCLLFDYYVLCVSTQFRNKTKKNTKKQRKKQKKPENKRTKKVVCVFCEVITSLSSTSIVSKCCYCVSKSIASCI